MRFIDGLIQYENKEEEKEEKEKSKRIMQKLREMGLIQKTKEVKK